MTRIRFSFLKKMGGISKRKKAFKETRRELEEGREEKEHVQLLHKQGLGVNPYLPFKSKLLFVI